MYKLTDNGVIHPNGFFIPDDPFNRHWIEYQAWLAEDNTPLPADIPTQAQIDKDEEVSQANPTAKAYFLSKPVAIAFIRLTPAEQEAQISGMTVAQKDTILKYLTIAVSALIKRELL